MAPLCCLKHALKSCRNILLRDFAILAGGHFGILATGVDNLTIDNLRIDTNRDGIDIDCCRNVRVSNCSVNSPWDDGICPKSSYALGYARATENMTITNCYVAGSYELGTMLDGTYKKIAPNAPFTAYASWNGDTRTTSWRVLGGPSPSKLSPLGGAPRSGFETSISVTARVVRPSRSARRTARSCCLRRSSIGTWTRGSISICTGCVIVDALIVGGRRARE